MRITRKLAVGATSVGLLLGVGGGVAYAQTSSTTTAPPPATRAPTAPSASNASSASNADKPDAAEASTPEAPETPGSEAAQPSDGPGGHADPPGDVQHQGGATEQ